MSKIQEFQMVLNLNLLWAIALCLLVICGPRNLGMGGKFVLVIITVLMLMMDGRVLYQIFGG